MRTYSAIFFGTALAAMFLTLLASRLAKRYGLVDMPGVRKVHRTAIPRIGGAAIMISAMLMIVAVLTLNNDIGRAFREIRTEVIVLLACSVIICAMGLVDDVRGLRARTKFAIQVAATIVVCAFGVRITELEVSGWSTGDLGLWSWPLTMLWILGITNAVNLIDGLDGLAGGIAAMTCGVIAVLSIWTSQPVMASLMLAMVGALTGFLFFNFNPAKIFMGDGGTYFVGFMIATASVMSSSKTATVTGLLVPLLTLGVPVLDMTFAIVRRSLERRSIMAPDRSHIHHRLLALGLNHRYAVLAVYALTLLMAGIGMWMMAARDSVVVIFACAGIVVLVAAFRIVGAVRLGESIDMMRRNRADARLAKEDKRNFEDIQLQMREARSLDTWWDTFCAMAEMMECDRVTLLLKSHDNTTRTLQWRRRPEDPSSGEVINMTFPLNHSGEGGISSIEIVFRTDGSLESAGRRITLFGRLIDEHYLETVLGSPRPQMRTAKPDIRRNLQNGLHPRRPHLARPR